MGKRETEKERIFRELFENNYNRLFYAALDIMNDQDEARDIVDETFASLWETFDPKSKSINSGYLFLSVKHRCIDRLKHKRVEEEYARSYCLIYREDYIDNDEEEERLRLISMAMEKIPRRSKLVLDQCYVEGKKYVEVAEMLGISREGVKKHIVKALKIIRDTVGIKNNRKTVP